MVRKRKTKKPKTVSRVACDSVDRISCLSDDLLVKVLSFLPTEDAVSTTILSKRWDGLWMWLPKLNYCCRYGPVSKGMSFSCFLDRSLPLHRAPVIESFHLLLCSRLVKPEDIKMWVVIALSRSLRELEITYDAYVNKSNILPSSLYNCKSLVTLKLDGMIRLDVPRMVCLPSLKTLELRLNKFLDGVSLRRLLSICPVLEDLVVHCDQENVDMGLTTINVPSLQSLCITRPGESHGILDELVINTPSLKDLHLEDLDEWGHSCLIENMPNLEDAYVDVRNPDMSSLIGSITSVKRLTICSETVYGDGFSFNQLEHLKLCVCDKKPSTLLVRFLENSPNLRLLDICIMDHYDMHPTHVPECIMSTLQAFNWSKYLERRPQQSLAISILGKRWLPCMSYSRNLR